jgi:two-component system, LytTR family, sensor kinase
MSPQRKYWLCQVLAWGGYSAISISFAVEYTGWRPVLVIGYLLYAFYSIAFTDLFRRLIHRRGWLDLAGLARFARIVPGVIIIGTTQAFLVVSIDTLLEGGFKYSWPPSSILWLWLGTTMATWTWTGVYVQLTLGRRRREKQVQLQLALRAAELRALEAQINPHFLFNCLNSIRGLVVEDPQKAQDMITRFAALLRYNLNRDRQHTVPFSEEAEIVADYLALESVRFEGRLRVQVTVDPEAQTIQVPPMILQALVENALKHGIARRPEGGDVQIQASASNGKLVLQVTNSGELGPARPSDTQLGLKNIRERLHLLYGDRASLSLQNGSGTVVAKVEIPRTA